MSGTNDVNTTTLLVLTPQDLCGNSLMNLGEPANDNDAARIIDVDNALNIKVGTTDSSLVALFEAMLL